MAENAATPYLKIEHLSKAFGDFLALKDISLEIYEGEFICFLGPSGCGKTTLLRAIAGLDIQTSGRIRQKGTDISALPPAERDFGIVFQSYALFPNLTVRKNVAYGLENKGTERNAIAKRVKELLELVGLGDQGDKYPAQLSGGQQQRVALARALATEPGLLLLDEPLSALDAKVRAHLRQEIKSLQAKIGVTTIMVTHDQEEALTMADRVVVMNQGIIEQIGTPADIYGKPASPFVADFIGTTNFISGTVSGAGSAKIGTVDVPTPHTSYMNGSKVLLCVRPEDVLTGDRAQNADGGFEATIGRVEFLGSFHRAYLALPGASEDIAADISVARVRELGIEQGRTIRIALPVDHMNVYPAGI